MSSRNNIILFIVGLSGLILSSIGLTILTMTDTFHMIGVIPTGILLIETVLSILCVIIADERKSEIKDFTPPSENENILVFSDRPYVVREKH